MLRTKSEEVASLGNVVRISLTACGTCCTSMNTSRPSMHEQLASTPHCAPNVAYVQVPTADGEISAYQHPFLILSDDKRIDEF